MNNTLQFSQAAEQTLEIDNGIVSRNRARVGRVSQALVNFGLHQSLGVIPTAWLFHAMPLNYDTNLGSLVGASAGAAAASLVAKFEFPTFNVKSFAVAAVGVLAVFGANALDTRAIEKCTQENNCTGRTVPEKFIFRFE